MASALATVVLSRLGVAGTIAGAAATPVIITLTSTALSTGAQRADGRKAALATALAAVAILVVVISAAEALAGKPLSDWGRHGGSGSTFGHHTPAAPAPTATAAPRPAGRARPSATATPTPAATTTPSPSPTPKATPTATATPAKPTPAPTP